MTRQYTEHELIATIPALTTDRLLQYRHLRIVMPMQTGDGPRYREIDATRITLLCELADDFELHEDALVIVMSLLDQLHGTRAKLDDVIRAVAAEDPEVKRRIARSLMEQGMDGPR